MAEVPEKTLWKGSPALRNQWALLLAALLCLAAGMAAFARGFHRLSAAGPAAGGILSSVAMARRKSNRYTVTSERVLAISGLLTLEHSEIELSDIKQLGLSRALGQRLLGVGTIRIDSSTGEDVAIVIEDVCHPHAILELIRKARLERRSGPPGPSLES